MELLGGGAKVLNIGSRVGITVGAAGGVGRGGGGGDHGRRGPDSVGMHERVRWVSSVGEVVLVVVVLNDLSKVGVVSQGGRRRRRRCCLFSRVGEEGKGRGRGFGEVVTELLVGRGGRRGGTRVGADETSLALTVRGGSTRGRGGCCWVHRVGLVIWRNLTLPPRLVDDEIPLILAIHDVSTSRGGRGGGLVLLVGVSTTRFHRESHLAPMTGETLNRSIVPSSILFSIQNSVKLFLVVSRSQSMRMLMLMGS